ncbi:hypothetical protein GCM10023195_38240 [Actinoallomurus liliacearum]|uniref:Uncharacterized protein n=1 Tax=Actinoallomurus liliacearum TaxID=1080073 RepID=A0ABP8TIZ9_9ACTN
MGHADEGQQARPVDGADDLTLDGHVGPTHTLNDRSHATAFCRTRSRRHPGPPRGLGIPPVIKIEIP